MGVHARCRQNMGAIDRHALRLVDGRGIAVVDPVVVLEVERDIPPVIGAHRHGLRADLFDGPERAVPDAKPAFVLQEHDAIPAGEAARAPLDRQTNLLAQITGRSHPLARGLIEGAHLVVGMGEDDAAMVRGGLPVAVPAVDQIVARLLACTPPHAPCHGCHRHGSLRRSCRSPDRAWHPAASPRAGGAPRRFPPAVTLMDGSEGRTGLDGLQLPGIADQHDFCAGFRGMGQHALQLARADHARLVDHQNVAGGQQVAALLPAMLHAGDGTGAICPIRFRDFPQRCRKVPRPEPHSPPLPKPPAPRPAWRSFPFRHSRPRSQDRARP